MQTSIKPIDYLNIKVYNKQNFLVYSTLCPRSNLTDFTWSFVRIFPADHRFEIFDSNETLRFRSEFI